MNIDVAKLDSQIRYLQNEVSRLGSLNAAWAQRNLEKTQEIIETLRQLRQEKQMTGMNGKRIDG